MPENITKKIYLKIIVCVAAIIGSDLSPDKKIKIKPQDGCNLGDDITCGRYYCLQCSNYTTCTAVWCNALWYK